MSILARNTSFPSSTSPLLIASKSSRFSFSFVGCGLLVYRHVKTHLYEVVCVVELMHHKNRRASTSCEPLTSMLRPLRSGEFLPGFVRVPRYTRISSADKLST